jgi:pre-rRNA-processing protein TSR1
VTPEDVQQMPKGGALSVVSLLPHENKVSVLNIALKNCNANDEADNKNPVKSKDVLTFRCGWRTWSARPVFSQHNLNSDKHKLERFLPQQNVHICASIFGPVTFTPCPVLAFRGNELVGIGSMINANADRIVVKRILLTGYPVKVRKRTAVVKYMFYNPDDVKWFQPAGLYTKHGLNGHIIQSVGEHGTMKCLFNAPIHQHDTVCLPLYKRIFPKYVTSSEDGQNDSLEVR